MNRGKILQSHHDRFIQSRAAIDSMEELFNEDIFSRSSEAVEAACMVNPQEKLYKMLMQSQLFGLHRTYQTVDNENCVPLIKGRLPSISQCNINDRFSLSPLCGIDETGIVFPFNEKRVIPKAPYKVLDAPALQDDFYLDLIHWSQQNILAVGLSKSIYLWDASNSKITKLCELGEGDMIASVAWSSKGDHLAIGSNKGLVQVWDYPSCKKLTSMKVHKGRVGTMSWCPDSLLLSTGSRDKSILHRDIRMKYALTSVVSKSAGHKQEVCGVRWSPDGQYLSSGGNDNKVLIWNKSRLENPCLRFGEHKAAVKALAWSNYQRGLLATGGGTADKTIKLWDTTTGHFKSEVNSGSQVCSMIWGTNADELVTTHGYSKNTVAVWKGSPLRMIAELPGHFSRVLYLTLGVDGERVVTGSGDETLRFWKVFPPNKRRTMAKQEWGVYPSDNNIR
eukprot:TRINITY_DN9519_c0_g1_i8.p1 TRINITY_DN9519_c0_g1~~TRINITY_DN9519_c0_g1_i8.p1  ORF type:complete len:449 (+),score=68.52 TRINITY_DN9519_c0_g1_i8:273-1619(+)